MTVVKMSDIWEDLKPGCATADALKRRSMRLVDEMITDTLRLFHRKMEFRMRRRIWRARRLRNRGRR